MYELAREVGDRLGLDLAEASVGGASDGNFVAALGIPVLDGLGASAPAPMPCTRTSPCAACSNVRPSPRGSSPASGPETRSSCGALRMRVVCPRTRWGAFSGTRPKAVSGRLDR